MVAEKKKTFSRLSRKKSNFQNFSNKFCRSLEFVKLSKSKFSENNLENWIFPGQKNAKKRHFFKLFGPEIEKNLMLKFYSIFLE